MALNEKDILDEILKYTAEKGGIHSEWYAGAAKDPQKALFKKHNVDKKNDLWMFDFAAFSVDAQRAVSRLVMMGFDGEAVNSDKEATGVFIYRKKQHTKE